MKPQISVDPSVMTSEEYNKDPIGNYQKLIKHYDLDGLQEMIWRAVLRAHTIVWQIYFWTQKKRINRHVLAGGNWDRWIRPTVKTDLTDDNFLFCDDVTDDMLVTAMINRLKLLSVWLNNQTLPAFMVPHTDNPEGSWTQIENYGELYRLYIQKALHTIEEYMEKGPTEEGFRGADETTMVSKQIFLPQVYLEHFGQDQWDVHCTCPFLSAHEDGPTGDIRLDTMDYYESMMVKGLRKSIGKPLLTPQHFPGC